VATVRYNGGAQDIADVWTATPGGTIGTETFSLTVNNKAITYTAESGDAVAEVVDGLVAAWNASGDSEITEATAVDSTTLATITGDTKGVPLVIGSSATGSATLAMSNTVAATGKRHWGNDDNWDTGTAPVSGDSAIIDVDNAKIYYDLGQSAVTLSNLLLNGSRIELGLADQSSSSYSQYRDTALQISVDTLTIRNCGGRCRFDLGSENAVIIVERTASSLERRVPALRFVGTGTVTLEVRSGSVGYGFNDEVANLESYKMTGGIITLGTSVVVGGNGEIAGGAFVTRSALVGVTVYRGGSMWVSEGGVTTLTLERGSACSYLSSGNITTAVVGGVLSFASDLSARIITNTTLNAGGRILDPAKTVTYTNPIELGTDVLGVQAGG
jgi:hypothetical protein